MILENYTELFDETAEQIESMSEDKVKYCKYIMRINFKKSDNLMFNEIINSPVCVIVVGSVFKENDDYYPQISLHDCFYEHNDSPNV